MRTVGSMRCAGGKRDRGGVKEHGAGASAPLPPSSSSLVPARLVLHCTACPQQQHSATHLRAAPPRLPGPFEGPHPITALHPTPFPPFPPPSRVPRPSFMSSDILGVLVVIILRGKNLPNKVRIGKQNPFATISYRSTKKKTTAIERGGQAPEWDEEFRFEIREDGDEGAKVALDKSGGVENVGGGVEEIPPVTPVKRATGTMEKVLKIAAWADDPRDPKLIGEVHIDLVPILKKGAKDGEFQSIWTGERN